MTAQRLGYSPALDGLRAVAVSLTILEHAETPHAWGGFLGVDMFFVLSGFLITTLLLEEIRDTGKIRFLHFYARRALRLYPALLLMLLVEGLAVWLGNWDPGWDFKKAATVSGLYLTDYAMAFHLMPLLTFVTHTWSLAVEEHFYLLWPPLLVFLCRRYKGMKLARALFIGWLLATVWKLGSIMAGQPWETVYCRFDTHMSGLWLGAFLAAFRFHGGKLPKQLAPGLAIFGLLTAASVVSMSPLASVSEFSIYTTVAGEIFTFFLIARIMDGDEAVIRPLSWKPAVMLGRISYGMYLFHYAAAQHLWPQHNWPLTLAVSVTVGLILSTLSYVTLEAAARKLRKRFGRGH
jgi:peptidoglycan/LPS O-acetylase OafA/YrhL